MRDDVVNHRIWMAQGKSNGGKSKAERISLRAFARMFDEPSKDNSITDAEYSP